jgi:hypothetical protein
MAWFRTDTRTGRLQIGKGPAHRSVLKDLSGVRGQILYVWLGLEQTHVLGTLSLATVLHKKSAVKFYTEGM